MRLEYRVILDLDDAKLKEDRPSENVGQTIQEEIASHLESLHSVLGITGVTVTAAQHALRDIPADWIVHP
jgi:hypothetical protein